MTAATMASMTARMMGHIVMGITVTGTMMAIAIMITGITMTITPTMKAVPVITVVPDITAVPVIIPDIIEGEKRKAPLLVSGVLYMCRGKQAFLSGFGAEGEKR